ncbi:MAG: monofunctional biosynthetic peptidoglycan transglycosylase [Bacteroidota bacterium]|nr:monofunctional biosynthetic peptidoglycan transglycosylase [Bacteroidota bacterium]
MAVRKKKKQSTTPRKKQSKGFGAFIIKCFKFLLWCIIIFFGLSLGIVLFYKWVDPPFTFLMAKRKITAIFRGEPSKIHYDFVPYNQIGDYLKVAVVASEDQKFPFHNGFDLVSIAKAMEHNKFARKVHGASTISQQTAKNVFLWDGRNFVRKGLEVYFTFLIEQIWGKKRILEVYLNVIEMGPLTFGAEAVSYKYFSKPARKLSKEQACAIAAVLPGPLLFSINNPTRYIQHRKIWISRQIDNLGGTKYINLK